MAGLEMDKGPRIVKIIALALHAEIETVLALEAVYDCNHIWVE